MDEEIVNRVAQSGIEQIDLTSFKYKDELVGVDISEALWNGFVLKEDDFRNWVKEKNWDMYSGKAVHVFNSVDAIIPSWAYMLITAQLQNANSVLFGNRTSAESELFFKQLELWDVSPFKDKIVMVKGCSDIPDPEKAYLVLTRKLQPVVKTLMFGEPCSAVPVYKRK